MCWWWLQPGARGLDAGHLRGGGGTLTDGCRMGHSAESNIEILLSFPTALFAPVLLVLLGVAIQNLCRAGEVEQMQHLIKHCPRDCYNGSLQRQFPSFSVHSFHVEPFVSRWFPVLGRLELGLSRSAQAHQAQLFSLCD